MSLGLAYFVHSISFLFLLLGGYAAITSQIIDMPLAGSLYC